MTNAATACRHERVKAFEIMVLKFLYPGASGKRIQKLWRLAHEKGIHIASVPHENPHLERLMCSIIRHDDTQYECVIGNGVGRSDSRGLVQPIIRKRMEVMKGEKHGGK